MFNITPENINKLKLEQLFMCSLSESVNKRAYELDRSLKDLLKETMANFGLEKHLHVMALVTGGCMVRSWDPAFMICSIYPEDFTQGRFINIDGNWIFAKITHSNPCIFTDQLDFKRKMTHVDTKTIDQLSKVLTEKTGLRVDYYKYNIYFDSNTKMPTSVEMILSHHSSGSKIICQGKKLCNGIEEPWVILETRDHGLMFYYSTNGLGLGYDKKADSMNKTEFFSWFGLKNKLASIVSKKQYERIVY
jgi:hypothetical protein